MTMTIIHAEPELLGRRQINHPPVHLPTDDGLATSAVAAEITCAWCRRTLGLLDETPLPDAGSETRQWTVFLAKMFDDESAAEVRVDADRLELTVDPVTITLMRDGVPVFGAPLSRVTHWLSEDSRVEKDAPAS